MTHVQGLADLNRRLMTLVNKEATRAGQAASRAGANVVAKAVRKAAPIGPDPEGSTRNRHRKSGKVVQESHAKISKNIKVRKVKSQNGEVRYSVRLLAYHTFFVIFGSAHNTPDDFVSPAVKAVADEAVAKVKDILEKQLIKRGA